MSVSRIPASFLLEAKFRRSIRQREANLPLAPKIRNQGRARHIGARVPHNRVR